MEYNRKKQRPIRNINGGGNCVDCQSGGNGGDGAIIYLAILILCIPIFLIYLIRSQIKQIWGSKTFIQMEDNTKNIFRKGTLEPSTNNIIIINIRPRIPQIFFCDPDCCEGIDDGVGIYEYDKLLNRNSQNSDLEKKNILSHEQYQNYYQQLEKIVQKYRRFNLGNFLCFKPCCCDLCYQCAFYKKDRKLKEQVINLTKKTFEDKIAQNIITVEYDYYLNALMIEIQYKEGFKYQYAQDISKNQKLLMNNNKTEILCNADQQQQQPIRNPYLETEQGTISLNHFQLKKLHLTIIRNSVLTIALLSVEYNNELTEQYSILRKSYAI